VPGQVAANNWAPATATAIPQVICSDILRPFSQPSTARITTPPIRVAQATGAAVSGSWNFIFFMMSPPAAVMRKATASLER
jgi:hypothetical protein